MNTDLGMQYIMDGNGNYYMLDGRNQLVVAKDRNEAGLFTFLEANRRIGGGKRARFYHTIPVTAFGEVDEEINSENLLEPKTNIVAMPDIREEEEMQN